MVYSTRRFVLCLALCYFVLVFFSPFIIAITSLWEKRASLGAFRTFVRFALVWFCQFPLPFGAWEEQRFMIVVLPGLLSYRFFTEFNIIMIYIESNFTKLFKKGISLVAVYDIHTYSEVRSPPDGFTWHPVIN